MEAYLYNAFGIRSLRNINLNQCLSVIRRGKQMNANTSLRKVTGKDTSRQRKLTCIIRLKSEKHLPEVSKDVRMEDSSK